ncbi:MAG: hypothetical protein PCFJNLEI_03159 [Verrucomicrobiae bacterium]|nr:hypothetical protein [Verrucomicrobiae bacterium]
MNRFALRRRLLVGTTRRGGLSFFLRRTSRRLAPTVSSLPVATLVWLILAISVARAEEPPPPTFGGMIGGLPSRDHSYIAESWLDLPVLRVEPLTLTYRYAETSPFFKENAQAQLLYARYELQAELTLCDQARLLAVGGYRQTQFQDRPGSLSAYVVGAGLGSPRGRSWLEWAVVAGGYLSRERLDSDWWADGHAIWRVWQGAERNAFGGPVRPAVGLAVDVESANEGGAFRARYRVGPVVEMLSANGNQLRFEARWYHTDGNPFYEDRDSGLVLGVGVEAAFDQDKVLNARDERPSGLLPVVWGQYSVGYGNARAIQKFEVNAEVHDIKIRDHRITPIVWYESRQEQRDGDYDNISYCVSPGIQAPIGLASPVSQGQPLVLGVDYLHRSAHALAPDAARVPPGTFLERNSVNIVRLRWQTLGWDLPYRDPAMYDRKTEFLNYLDWRVTLGYDWYHSRDRHNPAAQLGLNWDAATIQGNVLYGRGLISVGNEIPDWFAECGIRRPWGKVFFSVERAGLESRLGSGTAVVGGIGFHL